MIEFREVLFGLFMSYFSVSITESLSHGKLLHASNRRVRSWSKLGVIGAYIRASWYSHHVVHHFRTFRTNYVTMFSSSAEEKDLKNSLIETGKEQVVLNSYGLRVGGTYRKIQYLYTHIIQLVLICYFCGNWPALGVLIVVVFYVWLAECIHPYIHLPYSDALRLTNGPMKLFVRSSYFKYLASHHFIHHKYIDCNFNLVLGGDYFLRCHRPPSSTDIAEMKSLGLFTRDRNKLTL